MKPQARHRNSQRRTPALWLLLILPLLVIEPCSSADIKPYSATYAISRSGFEAERVVELTREGDQYRLTATTRLKGLGTLLGIGSIVEISRFRFASGTIQPILYTAGDDSDDPNRKIRIEFDWISGTSRAQARGADLTFPLTAGVLDPLSFELMARIDLGRGVTEPQYIVHEGEQLRRYRFIREQAETIRVHGRDLKTQRYLIDRNSNRQLYYWLATDLDHLVIQLKQLHKGKVKTTGVLVRSTLLP